MNVTPITSALIGLLIGLLGSLIGVVIIVVIGGRQRFRNLIKRIRRK